MVTNGRPTTSCITSPYTTLFRSSGAGVAGTGDLTLSKNVTTGGGNAILTALGATSGNVTLNAGNIATATEQTTEQQTPVHVIYPRLGVETDNGLQVLAVNSSSLA